MFLTGFEPDYVAWPDLLDPTTVALRAASARRDDENLAEWMRVPRCSGTWFKCDGVSRAAPAGSPGIADRSALCR